MNSHYRDASAPVSARLFCALGLVLTTLGSASADEGVWTFDSPPAKVLQAKYGFTPSARSEPQP